MLALTFTEQGYQVETLNRGRTCLERIREGDQIDLVLLDLGLPDIEGIDVLRAIRRNARRYELPVIINSGVDSTDRIVEALEIGANDFIMKPADTKVFLARVKVCIKLARGMRDLLDQTRRQVMQETIGAACHHVAQPMTALQTGLELFIREIPQNLSYERDKLRELLRWAKETSETIHRLQNVQNYKTVSYHGDSKILDIQPDESEQLTTAASPLRP
jgi:DNA-binding response OmpR family regulator